MAFQTPITIKSALQRVHSDEYVLPAIQREFVWSAEQIELLFDSLMRRYPIGAFLFWRVEEENSKRFAFYRVMRTFHARTQRHNEQLNLLDGRPLTAILDGQQRLTALNIGLNGSYAAKLPRKWATSPDAYPVRELHLDLCWQPAPDADEDVQYRFEFLTREEAASRNAPTEVWYRASRLASEKPAFSDMLAVLAEGDIQDEVLKDRAARTLERLSEVVHVDPVVAFHEESDQEIDRVLDIFIRVNSAGTVLSYSDLLLSVATAQWTDRDAREEVLDLVDELNETGQGFEFTKNLVLKSGLVMTDATDVRFKVANFDTENMSRLERDWERIASALRLAARLLASFGFSARTLSADSVLIPIADHAFQRGHGPSWLTSSAHRDERESIRSWVLRGQLRGGIWGSGLDQLLTAIRRVQREHPDGSMPISQIEAVMAQRNRRLDFTGEEVEGLMDLSYRTDKQRVFAVLALLYPGVDVRHEFHVDHVFPQALFTTAKLRSAGFADEDLSSYQESVDLLPNLQLLPGADNIAKKAQLPAAWIAAQHADTDSRDMYLVGHDLRGLPDDLSGYLEFVGTRRKLMSERLASTLGIAPSPPPSSVGSPQ